MTINSDSKCDKRIKTDVMNIKNLIILPIIFSSDMTAKCDINKSDAIVLKKQRILKE
ncbi:hypothetical protein SAMN02745176_03483 [Lutispora thermophila DSM 19022]|uniref:Uncharacterized protein n=1 Tax=Lutispora thermophila DSM 19022 TaxID=1122184 RepID=A0A1M6J2J8_9FIRM|nr:hypothetical protein SAMN02745176_03483 [Lutispora thermophila DSM 19022]